MKRLLLLIMFSQVVFMTEAKQKNVEEGIDVLKVQSNTQNGAEFRTNAISADITGNTLTITFNENVGIENTKKTDSIITQSRSFSYITNNIYYI